MLERYEDNDDYSETLFSYHRYLAIQMFCKGKTVVDMACGTGYGSNMLAEVAKKVTGLDIDAVTIKKCQQKYNKDNLSFVVGDVSNIGIKSHSVDVFVSCETIEHIDENVQKMFISEIKRILCDDGLAIITTPNKQRTDLYEVKNQFHIKELYPAELINLVKKEFKYYQLFYMDINMVSCIFSQDTKLTEKPESIKLLRRNSNDMSQNPIYMLIVCSNKESNLSPMSSVLYDFGYKFTNYLWGQLGQKDCLEKQVKLKDNEIKIKDTELQEKSDTIIELDKKVEQLLYKQRSIVKKIYQKIARRGK